MSRKISLKFTDAQRAVMFNTSSGIPNDAMLFDNGATLNYIKTDAGRLVGSFIENADGDISVGDESSSLSSVYHVTSSNGLPSHSLASSVAVLSVLSVWLLVLVLPLRWYPRLGPIG